MTTQSPGSTGQDPAALRPIEVKVWHAVLDVHGQVFGQLNRALSREFGITLAKFDVLAQLYRFSDGLTQGVLSRYLKVTDGNITGLVRRLGADGLVTREMSTSDRRAFVVRLTARGEELFLAARNRHDALLHEWLHPVGPTDLQLACNALAAINRHIAVDAARGTS